MKIYRNRMTNKFRVMGKYGLTEYFDTKSEALRDYQRVIDNGVRREKNQILRDLTGTSAAAARRDMGI